MKQRPNVNEGLPASESHTVSVRMAPAFDALPASADVHKQRRIAAVLPFLDRAVCDGAVRTFSEVDVLEVEGRSSRNLESRVMRADVNNSCRNSPFEEACPRWCARLEVDTPLYYGFRRNNTPEHAKRLIPRCVTSTPR